MVCLYRMCAGVLIVAVLNLQVPAVVLAAQTQPADTAEGITKNEPETFATSEVDLPGKISVWWWVLGGLAVGGGIAVAAGGHGGGGGGGGSASTTGTINYGW